MYYIDITPEDLRKLQDGIGIIERLYRSSGEELPSLYLYGLSQDPGVLDAAKEAIASYSDEELSEEDVQLTEVVVELRLSEDVLYGMLGSGVKPGKNDQFAFTGGPGEGIREIGFQWAHIQPRMTAGSFTKMGLASDSGWGDKFLQQYGNKAPMQVKVQRNEPATGVAPAQAAPPAAPGQPKQTSVHGAKQLRDLLENFLGD